MNKIILIGLLISLVFISGCVDLIIPSDCKKELEDLNQQIEDFCNSKGMTAFTQIILPCTGFLKPSFVECYDKNDEIRRFSFT